MKNKSIFIFSVMGGLCITIAFFILISFLFPEKKITASFDKKKTRLIPMNLEKEKKGEQKHDPEKNFSYNLKNFILDEENPLINTAEKKVYDKNFEKKEISHDLDSMIKKEAFKKELFSDAEKNEDEIETSNIFEPSELDDKPFILKSTNPQFPLEAKRMGIKNAKILVKFVVNKNGNVEDIVIVSSTHEKIFDENTINAVKKWKFSPGIKNGQKVSTLVYLPVRYVYKN